MRTVVNLLRVKQWTKNAFLLLPLLFSGQLLDAGAFGRNLIGFVAFCLIASGVYIMNDLRDLEEDRCHPTKRNRPIASGKVSRVAAIAAGSACLAAGILLCVPLGAYFTAVALTYIANNVLYSLVLKHLAILDVLSVALGFVLRVFAGAFATECVLSSWIVLCMFMLALFLAIEKRYAEMRAYATKPDRVGSDGARLDVEGAAGNLATDGCPKPRGGALRSMPLSTPTRAVLGSYSTDALKGMSLIAVALTIMSYSLYTFSASASQYMMITIVFVVYGAFRYLLLADSTDATEAPDRVLLEDKPILIDVLAWAATCAVLLYIG